MSPSSVPSAAVEWLPWGPAAFVRARAEQKPVLLSIAVPWCQSCLEMDRTSYADEDTAAVINQRFVPVRVDADERPDVSERYTLGGWPTTAFLSPGGDILGGGTFVDRERMRGVLDRVLAAFARGPAAAGAPSPLPASPSGDVPRSEADLARLVFDTFDAGHGGFGAPPKFPHVAPVRLAIDLWKESHDEGLRAIAVKTLDAMGWGPLYDEIDGGFFRCAANRDWQVPQTAKLLDANAALLRLYLDAGAELGLSRLTGRASDILRYVQTWLSDPEGGWFGAQQADDRYYAATEEDRRLLPSPPVGAIPFTDANGSMVGAALHAARVLDDEGLRAFALTSLERVLLAGYRPGDGVAHFSEWRGPLHPARLVARGDPSAPLPLLATRAGSGARGLLADQVAMAAANLDAFDATGNVVYEMMAEELAHYAIRTMWDPGAGGFFDRAEQEDAIGLVRQRLKPFVLNCEAAQVLRRLSATSGEREFARAADSTLAAIAPRAAEHGPLAAHFLLARRQSIVDSR